VQNYGTVGGTAPLIINPVKQLNSIRYNMPVSSAQVKSALIFAGLFADGSTTIIEKTQTRDHTERMLGLRSATIDGNNVVEVQPDLKIPGKRFFVPGDISAAAFLIAAGLIVPGSNIRIQTLDSINT